MAPAAVKDVWKSATEIIGALSVMIHGLKLMLMWPADSWGLETVVRELFLLLQNLQAQTYSSAHTHNQLHAVPCSLVLIPYMFVPKKRYQDTKYPG